MGKKHSSGFVPVPFKLLGKFLFVISLVMIILKGLDYLIGWVAIPLLVLYMGVGFLLISLYLLFVVPSE